MHTTSCQIDPGPGVPRSERRCQPLQATSCHIEPGVAVTDHAWGRMLARHIDEAALEAALLYGRLVHVRGAEFHVIGRKEVERWAAVGVDLTPFEGVQVVCSSEGAVLTVYRNRDLRQLRPQRSRRPRRRGW